MDGNLFNVFNFESGTNGWKPYADAKLLMLCLGDKNERENGGRKWKKKFFLFYLNGRRNEKQFFFMMWRKFKIR